MKVKKESRIFYAPQLKSELGEWTMTNEESHHLIKVLRLQVGNIIQVVNGHGLMAQGEIINASKKSCVIEIEKIVEERMMESKLIIAIAPTKNIDRFEWFLEKATEIGVGSIIPFVGDHSERKLIKNDRLDKIIVSAMKQSGRLWKPALEPLCAFEDILKLNAFKQKYIAHCHDVKKTEQMNSHGQATLVVIGPEGGFSSSELNAALEKDFKGLSLGDFRLRSETAGIIACQLYNRN